MDEYGFVGVVEKVLKWRVGLWYNANLLDTLKGLLMGLLTRGLGWTAEQTT